MAIAESSTVAVSYVGVGAGGGEQSPPISLQNDTNATPAAPNTPGGDPGLTVLQPPVSQPQVASAIPPYSTMLPSFGHYATGEYWTQTTLSRPLLVFDYDDKNELGKSENGRTEGKLGSVLKGLWLIDRVDERSIIADVRYLTRSLLSIKRGNSNPSRGYKSFILRLELRIKNFLFVLVDRDLNYRLTGLQSIFV